jgi:hypothetical protein
MPFDMWNNQGCLAHDASILSTARRASIVEHALETFQGEMAIMQMQLWEVTLKCDALNEKLIACQTKCFGLEQDVAT